MSTKVMVKFVVSSPEHTGWGSNDDAEKYLEIGKEYELLKEEVHSWHTKYYLKDFPDKKFNSTCFEPSRICEGYNEYHAS